jgi:serine-type D-Ala-D-Ala carboxypeptidase
VPEPSQLSAGPLFAAAQALLDDAAYVGAPPPGVLLAIARDGRRHYAVGGDAQRAEVSADGVPVPMSWPIRTDAGSVTKILATTASVLRLVDSGAVQLDAPAARYLPQVDGRDFTVRDLLEHRAGLWEWWPLYLSGARGAEAVTLAAELPLRYAPGSARHYSDLGFMLLGELVARVAAAPLVDAVASLALAPFGLDSTSYAAPRSGGPVAASSTGDVVEQTMIRTGEPYPVTGSVDDFARWRTHVLIGEVNDGNAFHAFDGTAGHAGLFTTAADLLRFATSLLESLRGDGPVGADTLRQFLRAGADPQQGLGFRLWPSADPESGMAAGHTGFPGVAFAMLPRQDAAVVMITNRLHATGPPRPTDDMWQQVLTAARQQLDEFGSDG